MTVNFFRSFLCFTAVLTLALSGCARVPVKTQAPPSSIQVTRSGLPAPVTHRVEHGQTLYRIAKKYRIDLSDLMRVNQIHNPSLLKFGQTLVIPGQFIIQERMIPSASMAGMSPLEIDRLIGSKRFGSDWRTITIHHSATVKGSGRLFHRDHLKRKMGGLFYHFVIGNGSYSGDGELEVGWRWKRQIKANRPYDIQICLVGNFSRSEVSAAQFGSLARLIRTLSEQYGISIRNVRRHEDIKGKNTECPGKYFPFHKLLTELSKNNARR